MARWWRRGPGTDPASTHDVSPVGTALNTPVQRAAWRDLPPLRPTVTATTPVAPLDTFTASLATARNPSFLGSLGHVVDPDGPSGMVGGLAAPIVPQQVSAGPELAFPSIGAPSAGIVQRLISPWLRSAPTASPDPAPAPSQTPTPAVAYGAVTDASPEAPMPDADMPRRLPSVDSGIPVRTGSMTLAPETAERATLPVLSAPRHGDRVDDAAVPTVSRSAGPHPTASPPPMNASPVAHSAADPTPQPTAHPTAHPAAHPAASPDPDPTPVLGWSEVVLPSFAPLIGSESSTAAVDPGHGLASADDGRTAAAPKRDRPSGVSTPSTVQRSLGLGAPLSMPPTVSRAADPAPDITSGIDRCRSLRQGQPRRRRTRPLLRSPPCWARQTHGEEATRPTTVSPPGSRGSWPTPPPDLSDSVRRSRFLRRLGSTNRAVRDRGRRPPGTRAWHRRFNGS